MNSPILDYNSLVTFSSGQSLSCVRLFATPWTAAHPSPTPGACSNSCTSSPWCIQPSLPLSSPSPPALNLFQHQGLFKWMSQFFTSRSQNIGASALASVLPTNIPDWFPLEWTLLISLLSKVLSRVFSKRRLIQKHQFFGAQLSLWLNSHIYAWLLEKPSLWLDGHLLVK